MDPKILKQLQDIENNNDFDNQNTVNYFLNIITRNMYWECHRNGQNPSTAVSSTLILMYMFICRGMKWIYWKTRLLKLGCQSQTKNLTVPTLSIGSKYDTMDPRTHEMDC
jgi:proline iminopeptidase